MFDLGVDGLDRTIEGLRHDADLFRRDLRKNLRKAGRTISSRAQTEIPAKGITRRTGTLERSIRGVIRRRGDYEFDLNVRPRKVNLGVWISSGKYRGSTHSAQTKRIGDPFYWYFLEYGTRSGFRRSYSQRSRNRNRTATGTGIRAYGYLLAAGQATQDEVIEIVGDSFGVFFE